MKITFLRFAPVGALVYLATATSAMATLIGVTGNGALVAPPAQVLNAAVTNTLQWGFNERQGVLLGAALSVDAGSIAAGTVVDSHMIFLNGDGSAINTLADWTFSGIVLGVMSDNNGTLEVASTALLGAPATTYPAAGFGNRGFESADSYSGVGTNTLRVDMSVTQPGDWIRVVTQARVPDSGSSALLLCLGTVAMACFARRNRGV